MAGIGRCAEAISSVKNMIAAPFRDGWNYAHSAGEKDMRGLFGAAFKGEEDDLMHFTHKYKDADGAEQVMHLNAGKMAGAAAGLGLGYRFLSGGGAYRDKNGNTDIAGIPFV